MGKNKENKNEHVLNREAYPSEGLETAFEEKLKEIKNPQIVKACFIATAALGSELHPHVQSLREFRDNILLRSKYKKTFENLLDKYYRFSPPIAMAMKRNLFLKLFLRYSLVYPVVYGIKIILPIINVVLGIERDAKAKIHIALS